MLTDPREAVHHICLALRPCRNQTYCITIKVKIVKNLDVIKMYMTLRSDKRIKMKLDFTRLTKIQRSLYCRGLDLWNSMPESFQKEASTVKFKSKVKEFIT